MLRVVTLVASNSCMLAEQWVPGFTVVKGFGIPHDEVERLAVVLGMAARAILGAWLGDEVRMQTSVSAHPPGNLRVTIETTEYRFSCGKFVAGGALGRGIQRLVRAGERAG